jgi:hypothetical protein
LKKSSLKSTNTKKAVVAVTRMLYTRQVPISVLGWDTGWPYCGFSWFSLLFPGIHGRGGRFQRAIAPSSSVLSEEEDENKIGLIVIVHDE